MQLIDGQTDKRLACSIPVASICMHSNGLRALSTCISFITYSPRIYKILLLIASEYEHSHRLVLSQTRLNQMRHKQKRLEQADKRLACRLFSWHAPACIAMGSEPCPISGHVGRLLSKRVPEQQVRSIVHLIGDTSDKLNS